MPTLVDQIAGLFDPYGHNRDNRSRPRTRAKPVDLSTDAPRGRIPRSVLLNPSPAARGTETEGYNRLQRSRLAGGERSGVQRRAQRIEFLAEAAAEGENRERASRAILPASRQVSTGVDAVTGQATYREEPVSQREVIQWASAQGNAPVEFLQHLIGHESGGRANARPRLPDGTLASSAVGHGQFIESTWLDMMRRYGARYGAGDLAAQIVKSGGPRNRSRGWTVRDEATREQIMAMREDPRWAAVMTAHYADENASGLRARLGRNVQEGEVYLAHFLGEEIAANMIRAGSRETQGRGVSAATIARRDQVEANRNVFYTRQGVARTAREVVTLQTRGFRRNYWPQRREATP